MERLLKKFLAKFVTSSEIKSNSTDLRKVQYKDEDKHVGRDLIAVGHATRTYLTEDQENISIECESRFFRYVYILIIVSMCMYIYIYVYF